MPTTWLAVLFFVLLVAPGLLYDLLAERQRTRAGESAFREASRTVLASLIISALSLSILAVIRWAQPGWMPAPNRLFAGTGDYVTRHYLLILRTLLLEGGIALSIAAGIHWIRWKRLHARLRPVSTWTRVFREELPPGFLPHVQVRLANGMTYIGQVGHFTADLETKDREIVLVPPLYAKKPEGDFKDMPPEWQRVVLSGTCVESLIVQYRPAPQASPSDRAAKRFRLQWVKNQLRLGSETTSSATTEQPISDAAPSVDGLPTSTQAASEESLMDSRQKELDTPGGPIS